MGRKLFIVLGNSEQHRTLGSVSHCTMEIGSVLVCPNLCMDHPWPVDEAG